MIALLRLLRLLRLLADLLDWIAGDDGIIDREYQCGICGQTYWLRNESVSPPDAPCSEECREILRTRLGVARLARRVTTTPCSDRVASCQCAGDLDHDGPHTCPCGGSWRYNGDGAFVPITFPSIWRAW